MAKNIFVIGLDDFNLQQLRSVRGADDYEFFGLIPHNDIVDAKAYPMRELLRGARQQLANFPGTVDAIIGHWDFPPSPVRPILRNSVGLLTPAKAPTAPCGRVATAGTRKIRFRPLRDSTIRRPSKRAGEWDCEILGLISNVAAGGGQLASNEKGAQSGIEVVGVVRVPAPPDVASLVRFLVHERDLWVGVEMWKEAVDVDAPDSPGEGNVIFFAKLLIAKEQQSVLDEQRVDPSKVWSSMVRRSTSEISMPAPACAFTFISARIPATNAAIQTRRFRTKKKWR